MSMNRRLKSLTPTPISIFILLLITCTGILSHGNQTLRIECFENDLHEDRKKTLIDAMV